MALTDTQIQQAYIAFFNRPADPTGLAYWSSTSTATVEQLLGLFKDAPEYTAQYTGKTNTQIVRAIYQNLFDREAEEEGLDYWVGELDAGNVTIDNVAWTILKNAGDTDAKDLTTITNKATAARSFTNYLGLLTHADAKFSYESGGDNVAAVAKYWLSNVGASDASKDSAIAGIGSVAGDLILTAQANGFIYIGDHPTFSGNDGDNYFEAGVGSVSDNTIIDGKDGYDTLHITIGDDNEGIAPTVKNVEKIVLTGQHVNTVGAPGGQDNNISDGATYDAGRTSGELWLESNNSRTDIKIEDVRIQDNQITKDVTIAFVDSNPGHVDYAVYFDQPSLRNEESSITTRGLLTLSVIDRYYYLPGSDKHTLLQDNVYDRVILKIDGVNYAVDLTKGGTGIDGFRGTNATYKTLFDNFLYGIEHGKEIVLSDKDIADGLHALTQNLINNLLAKNKNGDLINVKLHEQDIIVDKVDGRVAPYYITVTLTNIPLDNGQWGSSGTMYNPGDNALAAVQDTTKASTTDYSLVTSDIFLDYVGRGSKGGDLVIGGLSTGETSTSKGVQQFDITVGRDSQLEVISSTNNTLQEVYVRNDGSTYIFPGAYEQREKDDSPIKERPGDLIAQGNTNIHTLINELSGTKNVGPYTNSEYLEKWWGTSTFLTDQYIDGATDDQYNGYAFTDVRIFDASITKADAHINTHGRIDEDWDEDFLGNIKINAILTENVVKKYLDLKDQADKIAAADDLDFVYDLGTNDDVLDLAISSANLLKAGTTTFADFNLKIYGEAGNDLISTAIYNAEYLYELANAYAGDAPWYINSKLNANLYINAGDGDDVVNTFGSGDWIIDLGKGNDTYYADNTGHLVIANTPEEAAGSTGRATWIFNAADPSIARLTSDVNDLHWLYKFKVQVTFEDVESGTYVSKAIVIPSTNYRTSDHEINQAITKAINVDPVLSKLLIAEESVGSTLVVRALSDGVHALDDLVVTITGPAATDLTTQDVTGFKNAYVDYLVNYKGAVRADAISDFNNVIGTGDPASQALNLANFIKSTASGDPNATALLTKLAVDYGSVFATYNNVSINGYDSDHVSDNVIDAGKSYHAGILPADYNGFANAHDVIVLSTGENSHDTIKFTGLDDGSDRGYTTVVNFAINDANNHGQDYLDFSNAGRDGFGVFAAFLTTSAYGIIDRVALTSIAGAAVDITGTVNAGAYYVSVAEASGGIYKIELWQDSAVGTLGSGTANFTSTTGGLVRDTLIGTIGYVDFGGQALTDGYWDAETVILV
ncbi:hypothetical protein AGMMS50256_17010 [Betaproteobacteria bacterium]|nr:hypothetical protein AGMMS50256_17010 [Betaproteobacteria bacterium]